MERFDSLGYAIFGELHASSSECRQSLDALATLSLVEVCSSSDADVPGTTKNRTMVNVELQTREADSDVLRKRNFRMTVEEFYDFTIRIRKMINDANNRL